MRKLSPCLSLCIALFSFSVCAAAESFDFAGIMDIARNSNPELKQLKLNQDVARVELASSEYDLFPQLTLSAGYQKVYAEDYNADTYSTNHAYSGSLSVEQTLYAGGKLYSSYKKAGNNYRTAQYNYISKLNDVSLELKQLFLNVLEKKEMVRTLDEALKRKSNNYSLIKLLYQGGSEKKTNLDQAEYNLDAAQLNLLEGKKNLGLAKYRLMLEAGGKDGDYELKEIGGEDGGDVPQSDEETVAYALKNRIEMKLYGISLENSRLSEKIARSEYMPSVVLSGAYSRYGDGFFPAAKNLTGGIYVSLPISGGFPVYASVKEARLSGAIVRAGNETAVKNIKYQVKSALVELDISRRKLELAEKNLNIARDRSSIANLEYSQGNISFLEFEDIEDNLTSAESGRVEALYSYEKAKDSLRYYMGEEVK